MRRETYGRDRVTMWSVPPREERLYFLSFTILTALGLLGGVLLSDGTWVQTIQICGGSVIVSAGVSLIIVTVKDQLMLVKEERWLNVEERKEALRQEGRKELLDALVASDIISVKQRDAVLDRLNRNGQEKREA